MLTYLYNISILTPSSKDPVKSAPKKLYPKASVINVDDNNDDKLESAGDDKEEELSTYYYLNDEKKILTYT